SDDGVGIGIVLSLQIQTHLSSKMEHALKVYLKYHQLSDKFLEYIRYIHVKLFYIAYTYVTDPLLSATADDGNDGGGFDIATSIFSFKFLIVELKIFKFFKISKSTIQSISFRISEIRSSSFLIQLFIDADL
ncbi:8128_t:CDS:2, partial [Funneliformis geosporum]